MQKIKKLIKRILNWGSPDKYVRELHEKKGYLDAYASHTNARVAEGDAQRAIGGNWEEMGKLQFDFMVRRGMKPEHKMLDIGCGTLRGGRHYIKYLHERCYTGLDISAEAIKYGKSLVKEEKLSDKNPFLLVSEKKNLKFEEFKGGQFDYILAQSVITHLPTEVLEECFRYIGTIMHANSRFYFTYFQGERYRHFSIEDFCYPFSHLESLAREFGFAIKDYSSDYPHPIGQKMVEIKRA